MKNEYFINNIENSEFWFNIEEFWQTYEVFESDNIGKPPRISLLNDPLKIIELSSKEG